MLMYAAGICAGGIPPAEALLQRYCSSRGLSLPSQTDWAFYMALSIFRLLSILAGEPLLLSITYGQQLQFVSYSEPVLVQ